MNITIIGTGNMAKGIATRLLAAGNSVTLLSRSPEKAGELHHQLDSAAQKGATLNTAPLYEPLKDSIVINTAYFQNAKEIVSRYGGQLNGKILVDVSNVLNETYDDLALPPDTSGAEELAKLVPGARVVKAFNTTFAGVLAEGGPNGNPLDVFIAGDDAEAKKTLAQAIEPGGLRLLDAGPLKRARQLEGMGLVHIAIQSNMEKPWTSALREVG